MSEPVPPEVPDGPEAEQLRTCAVRTPRLPFTMEASGLVVHLVGGLLLLGGLACGAGQVGQIRDSGVVVDSGDGGQPTDVGAEDGGRAGDSGEPEDSGRPEDAGDSEDTGTEDTGIPLDTGVDMGVPDTGAPDTGAPDSGVGPATPVFVLQGDVGRTAISCDDGQSWIGNRSFDVEADPLVCSSSDAVRCYDQSCRYMASDGCRTASPCDCSHHPGSAKGLVYGNGWFVATFGWGFDGKVLVSSDGFVWQPAVQGATFGGIGYGDGRFLLASRDPRVASVPPTSFGAAPAARFQMNRADIWNVRTAGFSSYGGASGFVMVAQDESRVDVLIGDGSGSWTRPSVLPSSCLRTPRGVASGGNQVVIVAGSGSVCRSGDGGQTWTEHATGGAVQSSVEWDGQRFVAFGGGQRYVSTDGRSWTSDALRPSGTRVTRFAISPDTGTYVGAADDWNNWYGQQVMLRSTNGVDWSRLPSSAYPGSHPIAFMTAGYSSACP